MVGDYAHFYFSAKTHVYVSVSGASFDDTKERLFLFTFEIFFSRKSKNILIIYNLSISMSSHGKALKIEPPPRYRSIKAITALLMESLFSHSYLRNTLSVKVFITKCYHWYEPRLYNTSLRYSKEIHCSVL